MTKENTDETTPDLFDEEVKKQVKTTIEELKETRDRVRPEAPIDIPEDLRVLDLDERSVDIFKHFGMETITNLNIYSCCVEDVLIEQVKQSSKHLEAAKAWRYKYYNLVSTIVGVPINDVLWAKENNVPLEDMRTAYLEAKEETKEETAEPIANSKSC